MEGDDIYCRILNNAGGMTSIQFRVALTKIQEIKYDGGYVECGCLYSSIDEKFDPVNETERVVFEFWEVLETYNSTLADIILSKDKNEISLKFRDDSYTVQMTTMFKGWCMCRAFEEENLIERHYPEIVKSTLA